MAPSEGWGSGGDDPAEKALSFLSKSLMEVQKSTGMDMTLFQSRVQSFRDKSLTNFPAQVKTDIQKPPLSLSMEDFDLLKSLKPKLDRQWSDMSMQERKNDLWLPRDMDKALGFGTRVGSNTQERERRVVVSGARKKVRVSQNWDEPLKKVKRKVEERLRDLEMTAATTKTPVEFFENVKKAEFFENVKKNLVSPQPRCIRIFASNFPRMRRE